MTMSGVLATAGDLVFYGTADGWFRAVDARSGKVLWSHKLGSGVIGQPMTYLGPDKRQYVAVYSGVGGAAMVSSSDARLPAARQHALRVLDRRRLVARRRRACSRPKAARPRRARTMGMGGKP